MRSRICLAVFLTALSAFGYLQSVEVLPTQAAWSGWIPDGGYVGQTFTANFDSVCYCEVFLGDTGSSHALVKVVVFDIESDLAPIAYGIAAQTRSHAWLRFPLTTVQGGGFVRGKEYLLKVYRPGDFLQWYKDVGNKYRYGHMVLGSGGSSGDGQPPPQSGDDLCMRLYGKARVGNEFSVQSVVAWPNAQGNPKDT
ncbi:MAG: hypothetical protein NTY23_11865 [Chloroflexi bacterium]|nr:hypothetical protein [Chloroflexota bacterium]